MIDPNETAIEIVAHLARRGNLAAGIEPHEPFEENPEELASVLHDVATIIARRLEDAAQKQRGPRFRINARPDDWKR